MGFGMFSVAHSPIAIDFGSASVKLLQIGSGDRPPLLAAAELPIPDAIRADNERVMTYLEEWMPVMLRDGRFKSKKAVISVPSTQTFIQHMQIATGDEAAGISRDDLIKTQLQSQMGCSPLGVVVRSSEVCAVHRNGQALKEIICFAINKDVVMRYVQLLAKCKLEVVGVHTDTLAIIRSFDHLHRRTEDEQVSTLYVDLGWGGTRVAITHGKQIVFSRHVPIGGRHFDQLIASTIHSDMASARAHRLSLKSPVSTAIPENINSAGGMVRTGSREMALGSGNSRSNDFDAPIAALADRRTSGTPAELQQSLQPGEGLRTAVNVDLTELLDTITDELSMCLRYHQSLFRERPINRAIFVGGESRQAWLCQRVVKALRVPAQLGDPMARLDPSSTPPTPNLKLGQPQPGWAVACGLCAAQAAG